MSPEHCDVAVVGAGLVGLSLAYELACLGAGVTVVDAAHPGRATDAGAGILSPATSMESDPALWPFLRQAGAHYPALLDRLAADGADTEPAAYGTCGILSVGLRAHEDGWFAPFAELALRRSPGEVSEIPARRRFALPAVRPGPPRACTAGAARVDGRGMAAALRAGRGAAGRRVRPGRRARRDRGAVGGRPSSRSTSRAGAPSAAGRWPSRAVRGRPPPASGSAATCRLGRRRDRSCTSASRRRRAAGPSSSPC